MEIVFLKYVYILLFILQDNHPLDKNSKKFLKESLDLRLRLVSGYALTESHKKRLEKNFGRGSCFSQFILTGENKMSEFESPFSLQNVGCTNYFLLGRSYV